jgi:hypothetical protein
MAAMSSRTFLRTSLVIAFPLLVLAFGQIFALVSVRLMALLLPTMAASWPVAVVTWVLAIVASLSVCRMILRHAPAKDPPAAHSR